MTETQSSPAVRTEVAASHRSSTVLMHEEAVHRDPFSLQPWLSYLSHLSKAAPSVPVTSVFPIYERALSALPGSYKLWYAYTVLFRQFASQQHPNHSSRRAALTVSSRAAHALRVSPVLWSRFVQHLLEEHRLFEARTAIDQALRVLPITQHDHVWQVVCDDYPRKDVPNTAASLLLRYAKLAPRESSDVLLDVLISAKRIDTCVSHFAKLMADPKWTPATSTRHEFSLRLARATAQLANLVQSSDVSSLIRAAISEGGPSVAELCISLAEFHTRRGDFPQARVVFEEAISTTAIARDFALVYDAYAKFEETLITALLQRDDGAGERVETQLARLENLVDRRPMLLSDVHLRQNVHNVHEWHKRARMFKSIGHATSVVDTYSKAIRAVDAHRAKNGRVHTLWLAFARYYEEAGEISSARRVLESATKDPNAFRGADELVAVWCEFAEMELRLGEIHRAVAILKLATQWDVLQNRASVKEGKVDGITPDDSSSEGILTAVRRSRRIWHFLIDLLQSGDDVDIVAEAHGHMLDLRISSAATALSGAKFFEAHRLFERAFRLFDRGASRLPWPEGLHVWMAYLQKFVSRFGGRKLERARDLFEEAIRSAPIVKSHGRSFAHPLVKHLYLLYFSMEETYSLGRHALDVLSRAVDSVRAEDVAELFRLLIVKTAGLYGVSQTRGIYERALTRLPDVQLVAEFSTRFAGMEARLGEIGRARAVFVQCCHVVDTRGGGMLARFWKAWEEFERSFGDEDSMREMLRLRHRVQLDHQHVLIDRYEERPAATERPAELVPDTQKNGGDQVDEVSAEGIEDAGSVAVEDASKTAHEELGDKEKENGDSAEAREETNNGVQEIT